MQLSVNIRLEEPLSLPLNYNHIIQSVIYRSLSVMPDYASFLHEQGYTNRKRQYKMFHFGQLTGDYVVRGKKIIFQSYVMLEVRSPEPLLINILADNIWKNGITFGQRVCRDVELELYDYTVEKNEIIAEMKSPLTVYSTDREFGRTYYFNPEEKEFYERINENFYRKYEAYYGVRPFSPIQMEKIEEIPARKLVTRYQGVYIAGWYGTYELRGERKYLDFLYQAGLGSKNAQGFGMFEVM